MALDHHRGDHLVTNPGEVVGATVPGQSETREGYNTTAQAELARFNSRRKFIRIAAGASALFLFAGAGVYAAHARGEKPAAVSSPNAAPITPEATPSYEAFETKDLTMNRMTLPETLDPNTFSDVVANMGKAIEYAVNTGDIELIRRLIPGHLTGTTGTLQPGQFELRAAFIEGFRQSSQGTATDNPDNPQDPRYYPWGFKMELIGEPDYLGATVQDASKFTGLVRITMGDLPPLPSLSTNEQFIEPPQVLEVQTEFTRYVLHENGNGEDLLDITPDGEGGWKAQNNTGWGLASVEKLYPVPPIMTGNNLPKGFTEVPPLFKQS